MSYFPVKFRRDFDRVSKAALWDVLIDRCKLETGHPDEATDAEIAAVLTAWLSPVLRVRGDRAVTVTG